MNKTNHSQISRRHINAICEIGRAVQMLGRNLEFLSARERLLYAAVQEEYHSDARLMRALDRIDKRKKHKQPKK